MTRRKKPKKTPPPVTSTTSSDTPSSPYHTATLEAQFSALVLHRGLEVDSGRYRGARNQFIVAQWAEYFGEESKLANWQKLCHDVGIKDEVNLSSITKCKKALKGVNVNIWDLLDAVKAGELPVQGFSSKNQLAKYTVQQGRSYPKGAAKLGGPVRALLIHLFPGRQPAILYG